MIGKLEVFGLVLILFGVLLFDAAANSLVGVLLILSGLYVIVFPQLVAPQERARVEHDPS